MTSIIAKIYDQLVSLRQQSQRAVVGGDHGRDVPGHHTRDLVGHDGEGGHAPGIDFTRDQVIPGHALR